MKKLILAFCMFLVSYNAMALTCEYHYAHGQVPTASTSSMWLSSGNPGYTNTITLFLAGQQIAVIANNTAPNGGTPTSSQTVTYNGQIYSVGTLAESYCSNGKNCANTIYTLSYCYQPAGPTFSYTTTQDQAVACPATTPSGYILQRRSYDVYSDGSTKNFSAWYTVANYCSAVYQSTQTQTQTIACTAPYAEGGNGITQTQSRQIWSDGARAWSAWTTTSNTCYKTVTDTQPNVTGTCGVGQTGSIITRQVRTHKEYSVDSTKTAAQQAALNDQNSTVWTTVVVTNTCVNVPDQVTTTPGTRQLTCATLYGGSDSDYTGSVIETGTNVSSYSSATKQTTTVFKSNTPPTYNSTCQATVSDVTMETTTEACPTGETGTISLYRYVQTDSKGNKTYPSGTDYIESANTCESNTASADTSVADANTVKSKGLLANNTIKTSSLLTKTDMETFISTLDKSTMTTDSTYKLNLIVDDLSTGMYNKSNVIGTVNAFKNATGQDPIITVPQSLEKYIGNGGLTASNYNNYVLQSAVLNSNNQVVVTYSTLAVGINEGTSSSFTINLLN